MAFSVADDNATQNMPALDETQEIPMLLWATRVKELTMDDLAPSDGLSNREKQEVTRLAKLLEVYAKDVSFSMDDEIKKNEAGEISELPLMDYEIYLERKEAFDRLVQKYIGHCKEMQTIQERHDKERKALLADDSERHFAKELQRMHETSPLNDHRPLFNALQRQHEREIEDAKAQGYNEQQAKNFRYAWLDKKVRGNLRDNKEYQNALERGDKKEQTRLFAEEWINARKGNKSDSHSL